MAKRKVKKRETVDILGDLVGMIDTTVCVSSVTDNLDNTYTITSCDTAYLKPCSKFIHEGVEYTVVENEDGDFIPNETFIISGSSVPYGDFILPSMKYEHGTVRATTAEMDKKMLDTDKFPMVYLLEIIADRHNNLDRDRIDRNSDLRIFLLTNTDEENWFTSHHYKYAIIPMRNMLYRFIDLLNCNENIGEFDSYTAINHAIFGVYTSDVGHTKRVLNEKTSGVELRVNLPIVKGRLCVSC